MGSSTHWPRRRRQAPVTFTNFAQMPVTSVVLETNDVDVDVVVVYVTNRLFFFFFFFLWSVLFLWWYRLIWIWRSLSLPVRAWPLGPSTSSSSLTSSSTSPATIDEHISALSRITFQFMASVQWRIVISAPSSAPAMEATRAAHTLAKSTAARNKKQPPHRIVRPARSSQQCGPVPDANSLFIAECRVPSAERRPAVASVSSCWFFFFFFVVFGPASTLPLRPSRSRRMGGPNHRRIDQPTSTYGSSDKEKNKKKTTSKKEKPTKRRHSSSLFRYLVSRLNYSIPIRRRLSPNRWRWPGSPRAAFLLNDAKKNLFFSYRFIHDLCFVEAVHHSLL